VKQILHKASLSLLYVNVKVCEKILETISRERNEGYKYIGLVNDKYTTWIENILTELDDAV